MMDELTPFARRLRILDLLRAGRHLHIHEVAEKTGLTIRGAYYLMSGLCLAFPVAQDEYRRYFWMEASFCENETFFHKDLLP